jgi:phosphoglycerol transferase MdoB-like AlkP superfamily enzyme
MPERKFAPGFRLSRLDIVVLLIGGLGAVAMMSINIWIGLAIAFVVAHFFLFCNVLRITRPPELIWAVVFAAMVVAATVYRLIPWPLVFAVSAILTIVLAIIEMRKPWYHGIGWRRINPQLPQRWQSN